MKLIVKTLHGVEELLCKELENLGATDIKAQRRAVTCEADKRTMYKINLWSRFALRVLVPVLEFTADNDKEIYDHVYAYGWEDIIAPDKTMMIDHISFSSKFPNSQFLAFKTKDAIVDRIRDKKGARPSVDIKVPDVLLNVHATDELITVSLDATGPTALSRRGYRAEVPQTATNEILAAALVELSGWTAEEPLVDPMCGTGTICIEAAMKARNIAANYYRTEKFGFMNWINFDTVMWSRLMTEAKAERKDVRLNIIGSDVDTETIDIAKQSTLELGLTPDVRITRRSMKEQSRTTQSGIVITCPPVSTEGRRSMEDIYKEITYHLSHNFPDHDVWIYSSNLSALRAVGFRAAKKYEIYVGSVEGNFNMYPF